MAVKPREAALQALIRWRREGAWPDLYLQEALRGMPTADAALATTLTYGVLQSLFRLDFILETYSSVKLKKITPQVLDILRIAAYQLLYLGRVPDFAVVNEAVQQTKKHANPRAAGFVNALLRKVAAQRESLPQPDTGDTLTDLSIAYSHPRWLVEEFSALLGAEGLRQWLEANNGQAPVTARVNTLKISTGDLLGDFRLRGIDASIDPSLPDCLHFVGAAGLSTLLGQGLLCIQDSASQLCVHALDPRPGETLFDLCAAPGGKTFLAAQMMAGEGRILATDLHGDKIRKLEQRAAAYGLKGMASFIQEDATRLDTNRIGKADKIICDVPCSGLGIIRKKPDIRYKSPQGLENLPQIQYDILVNAGHYLKPGGIAVYSTCTLRKQENEDVVMRFLENQPGFHLEAFALPGIGRVAKGQITLLPHVHQTDGFYMARIRKDVDGWTV